MSSSGKRRIQEEASTEDGTAPAVARDRRRHRSAYPTPGFKAFGSLLNVLSLPLASLALTNDPSLGVILLTLLAGLGLVLAIYSAVVRPLATNIKTRKILTAVVAGYGFLMLVALGVNFLVSG